MGRKKTSSPSVPAPSVDAEKIIIDPKLNIFFFAAVDRPWFLNPHQFYSEQAQKRLLSQFSDVEMSSEATMKGQLFLESAGDWFNPDYHDESDVYENIEQIEACHWVSLRDMKVTVTLSLTAGMYHQFDKALRELLIREARSWRWLDRSVMPDLIWNLSFPRLMDLLEWLGIEARNMSCFPLISACHQVVNVYKHGDGDAHQKLVISHPEYYSVWQFEGHPQERAARHEELEVSEKQFGEFAEAITEFWESLPEGVSYSGMGKEPEWFDKAYGKLKNEKEKRERKT
ncbi:hypothetical protein [Citrobacter amalonaticus]|uniref:hypothetical protein n=1 Tax=Citrobacter amalonaticus TaxID=35703 RepID=UPI000ABBA556|nr:hypothetical protein [Citrobacter amalonaticus]